MALSDDMKLVNTLRDIEGEISQVNDHLYGIFGIGDCAEYEYRIARARKVAEEVHSLLAELLDGIQ